MGSGIYSYLSSYFISGKTLQVSPWPAKYSNVPDPSSIPLHVLNTCTQLLRVYITHCLLDQLVDTSLMDPTHSPLKHKRSFSTRAREKWNKFIGRSRSPSPSRQQSPRVPSVQSASQPPSPSEHSSLTPHIGLAPALAPQATATPPGSVRASPQAPGIGTPTLVGPGNDLPTIVVSDLATDSSGKEQASGDPATPVGSVSTNQPTSSALWAGLGIALQGLHKNACLFPPLQSAIDAFIPCLDILEVGSFVRS